MQVLRLFSAILISLLLATSTLYGQKISGTVYDSLTSTPIPFVHVFSEVYHTGTITNELGEFELDLPKQDQHNLTFSHISYDKKKINVDSGHLDVWLNSSIIHLDKITVTDEASVIAYKILDDLRESDITFGRAFYRQIGIQGTLATEFIEAFYDLSINQNGVAKIRLDQARFARRPETAESIYISFTNFAYLTLGYSLYSEDKTAVAKPFSTQHIDFYNFTKKEEYTKDGDQYVVISFEPSKDIEAAFSSYGSFLYNKSKEQLLEYNAYVDHALGFDQLTGDLKEKNVKIENPQYHWYFNLSDDQQINFVSVNFNYDLQIDQETFPSNISSKLIVYQRKNKPYKKLKEPAKEMENFAAFANAKYRPSFWRKNTIIKTTPEENQIIDTFNKNNAFGTYFK